MKLIIEKNNIFKQKKKKEKERERECRKRESRTLKKLVTIL